MNATLQLYPKIGTESDPKNLLVTKNSHECLYIKSQIEVYTSRVIKSVKLNILYNLF